MYDQFSYNGTLTDYPNKTDWYWITHSNNDYTKFNFDYHVPQWESDCVQVFGDQHARDSHTYLVNTRHSDDSPWQFHEHTVTRTSSVPVFHATNLQPLEDQGVRMFSNFFNFIKRCCNKTNADYFWVTASVCDYSSFDFTWHPDIGEEKFVHAWTTQDSQYGYTFFVPRQEFVKQSQTLQKLEWFEYIKYHSEVPVNQLPVNTFTLNKGVADAIKNHTFTHHYEWFIEDSVQDQSLPNFTPARWDEVNINCFGTHKQMLLVPREAKSFIIDQVYDYPAIIMHQHEILTKPNDIIFISYDESMAEEKYKELKQNYPRTKRVHGVKGQTQAYHKAAEISDTDYFFAVFPKLDIHVEFNFEYQPDRLHNPCHWIFNSYNPVNGLKYGHEGIILYNKKLVLETIDPGIDFTMSKPHDFVDIMSTTMIFNQEPWLAWRTAFREVVKLNYFNSQKFDRDTQERLHIWRTIAQGQNSKWVLQGAEDGQRFFESGQDLKLSYNFEWLKNEFNKVSI